MAEGEGPLTQTPVPAGGQAPVPAPAPAGAGAQPAPQSAPQGGPGQGPAPGQGAAQGGGAGQGGGQAAEAWASIRDAAREMGYDLSSHQDDRSALSALVQRARAAEQATELARYGQYFLENRSQFEEWQKARAQEQQQKTAQKEQSWWKAPEYDPRWRAMVQKDPMTGKLVPAEGAPPDVVQKYLTAVQHQQDFLDKFTFDPIGAVKPGIEEVARQIAMQVVQQHLGGFSDQQHAANYIERNSSWLHQRDAQGQVQVGQDGRPALSQAGQSFLKHFEYAVRLGIPGEEQRASYARSMVERELAVAAFRLQQQRQGQVAQGEQQKQNLLQQGAAAGGARVPAAGGSQQARVQNGKASLEERLRNRLAEGGVTEATLSAAMGGQARGR